MTRLVRSRLATGLSAAVRSAHEHGCSAAERWPIAAAKPELAAAKGRPDHPDRQHVRRADAILRAFRDAAARPLSRARAGGSQPGLFGRRAHACGRGRPISTTTGTRSRTRSPTCSLPPSGSTSRSPARPGLAKFKKDLESFIKTSTTTKYNGKAAPAARAAFADRAGRPQEPSHHRRQEEQCEHRALQPRDGRARRPSTAWSSSICSARRKQLYESSDQPLTINGVHLSDLGYKRLAPIMMEALFGAAAELAEGRSERALRRGAGEKPSVLLRLPGRQRLLHLRRPQGPLRRRQLPGRVCQAAQDDPEPRAANLGPGPGEAGARDDRRQQHRRLRHREDQRHGADQDHDPVRGSQLVHAAGGLRDQPVCLGGRVSRPGRPGLDDLRRQGPALGHDDAFVPDVSAGHQTQRQGLDPRRRQLRRQGRSMQGFRRRAARSDRYRARGRRASTSRSSPT